MLPIRKLRNNIMKIKSSLKKADLKAGDKLVKRGKKLFRINKLNPRRKARQG
ncbi:MAG: ribosomal protein L36 [Flavobacteriaceae bacterium]|jgi:ribosomal protein L36